MRFHNIACYVTDGLSLAGCGDVAALLGKIGQAGEAGADWVQLREKHLEGRELLALAKAAVERASSAGAGSARVIVNDRADVAIAAGAAGVHLGGGSAETGDVVKWRRGGAAPKDFLIGVSCHSASDVLRAQEAGADYVFLGPIFDTPSKREYGAPLGVAALREVCRAVRIPVIAIGGVDHTNIATCLETGATGIAAIRLFQDETAERIREAVELIRAVRS